MSDWARISTRYFYVCIPLMVVVQTHETFPRLFYRMPKNPRSLVGNPTFGILITLWRKTKVIFGISSSSCIELYIYNSFSRNFRLIFTGKPSPKPYRSVYSKRYKGITSDRAPIFTRRSYICILLIVVAQTHKIYSRLF
jgi:hypothetical protein